MRDRFVAIMTTIITEVDKFLKTKRLSNNNVAELDKRIGIELYLKDKKDAIIEDRKEKEPDAESNLNKVRARYQDLV